MSDYHVLEQSMDRKTIKIALHYTVPAGAINQVAKSYRDIIKHMDSNGPPGMTLKDEETGIITSAVPFISDSDFNPEHATEAVQIQNGEVLEVMRTFRFSVLGLTNIQKKAEIDAYWALVQTEISDELDVGIEYYGYSANATT